MSPLRRDTVSMAKLKGRDGTTMSGICVLDMKRNTLFVFRRENRGSEKPSYLSKVTLNKHILLASRWCYKWVVLI